MIDLTAAISFLKRSVPDLQAIYLFGSHASGHVKADSDVDLALLTATSIPPLHRWELAADCAVLLKCDVDLVVLRSANTITQYQVVTEGRRVYTQDARLCDFFENLIMSEYLDFQMFLQPIINDIRQRGSIYGR